MPAFSRSRAFTFCHPSVAVRPCHPYRSSLTLFTLKSVTPLFATLPGNGLVSPLFATHFQKKEVSRTLPNLAPMRTKDLAFVGCQSYKQNGPESLPLFPAISLLFPPAPALQSARGTRATIRPHSTDPRRRSHRRRRPPLFRSQTSLSPRPPAGDIVHRGQRTTFYFPLVSCIVISVLLSLILWIVNHFRR